jgi:hypothetical protein
MSYSRISITGTTISAASDRSWIRGQRNGYKEKARLGARECICEYDRRLVQTGLAEIMRVQSSS